MPEILLLLRPIGRFLRQRNVLGHLVRGSGVQVAALLGLVSDLPVIGVLAPQFGNLGEFIVDGIHGASSSRPGGTCQSCARHPEFYEKAPPSGNGQEQRCLRTSRPPPARMRQRCPSLPFPKSSKS